MENPLSILFPARNSKFHLSRHHHPRKGVNLKSIFSSTILPNEVSPAFFEFPFEVVLNPFAATVVVWKFKVTFRVCVCHAGKKNLDRSPAKWKSRFEIGKFFRLLLFSSFFVCGQPLSPKLEMNFSSIVPNCVPGKAIMLKRWLTLAILTLSDSGGQWLKRVRVNFGCSLIRNGVSASGYLAREWKD